MSRYLRPGELHALRQIPLPAVLRACGAQADRYDRQKWHTAQASLSLTGMQFMNWKRVCGGDGAIDLVMHLQDLDFPAAVAWLRQRFSLPAPASPTRSESRPIALALTRGSPSSS